MRGKLTKTQRKSIGALITIDVHAREVVKQLIATNVSNSEDFEWMRELRYYWEQQKVRQKRRSTSKATNKEYEKEPGTASRGKKFNLVARIVNAHQRYKYEYLGASMRLVITPLTDRCYRTMIGAVTMMYGGAPEGPAGTGKTETTKDLGKSLAFWVIVINCSDGMDYISLGRYYSGLAQTGAWGCWVMSSELI